MGLAATTKGDNYVLASDGTVYVNGECGGDWEIDSTIEARGIAVSGGKIHVVANDGTLYVNGAEDAKRAPTSTIDCRGVAVDGNDVYILDADGTVYLNGDAEGMHMRMKVFWVGKFRREVKSDEFAHLRHIALT